MFLRNMNCDISYEILKYAVKGYDFKHNRRLSLIFQLF